MRVGICEFKKPVSFKNGYLAEVILPLDKNPKVQITDVAKDDWQVLGVKENINPKIKTMTLKDFRKTFKVTHIKTLVGAGKAKYQINYFINNKIILPLLKLIRCA